MARQVNGHLGTFATVADLTAKFPPSESIGCSANVGTAIPYIKYWCDGNEWAGVNATAIQSLVSVDGIIAGNVGLTAQAAANRTIINTALALGGSVQILTPGTIYIDDSLVIPSRTSLKLGAKTRIKLYRSDTQPRPLLVNAAKLAVEQAAWLSCTLTWTAGRSVTINKTAHGLAVGQNVLMWSSTLAPSNYAGVFPIVSITDANSFVIRLHRTPNAGATGTLQYMVADQDITVEGGEWDMDSPARTVFGTDPLARYGMMMVGVANLIIRQPRLMNCPKYNIYLAGLFNFRVDDVAAEGTASDGIKVYGPAVKGTVSGSSLIVADNGVSIQTIEPAAYITYMMLWGDTHDIKILDTYATSVAGVVALLPSAAHYMGGIVIDGVSGSIVGETGVNIVPGEASAVADDITLRNIRAAGVYNVALRNNSLSGTIKHLVYDGGAQTPDDYSLDRNSIFQDTLFAVDVFEIRSFYARNPIWPLTSGFAVNLNGVIKHLKFIGGLVDFRNATGSFCQLLGAVTTVTIDGLTSTANCSTLLRVFAGTPAINIIGCDLSCTGVVGTNVACSVNVSGNRLNVGSSGLVRSNAVVAIKVTSGGNTWATSNVLSIGSGIGQFEFRGWDIPLNLNASGVQKTVPGQFVFNTTLAGSLAANRLAHCNGTNWLQLDAPANTF